MVKGSRLELARSPLRRLQPHERHELQVQIEAVKVLGDDQGFIL